MSNNNNKILVVAAHPDDEILGLGATLCRHRDSGDSITILILGNGEDARDTGVDADKRIGQAKSVAESLKAKLYLENFPDNAFDSVPLLEITKAVEKVVSEVKPNILYTHHYFDLNIDHRKTSQAVMTACRPGAFATVKEIFGFETVSSTEWQVKQTGQFVPVKYVNIENYLEEKVELIKLYKDEIRQFPHSRSPEGIKILAQYRGMESGLRAAEAFSVLRSIDD